MTNDKLKKQERRKIRVRKSIVGRQIRPRVSVFRSNRFISAQIIDDEKGKSLATATEKELVEKPSFAPDKTGASKDKEGAKTKTARAKLVGLLLAKKAEKVKVKEIRFDRSGYKYHGRVKALAEGLREGGLQF